MRRTNKQISKKKKRSSRMLMAQRGNGLQMSGPPNYFAKPNKFLDDKKWVAKQKGILLGRNPDDSKMPVL